MPVAIEHRFFERESRKSHTHEDDKDQRALAESGRYTRTDVPTTARALGSDSIPLLTISAIISKPTNCQESVLY
jgi:hypothetical protein